MTQQTGKLRASYAKAESAVSDTILCQHKGGKGLSKADKGIPAKPWGNDVTSVSSHRHRFTTLHFVMGWPIQNREEAAKHSEAAIPSLSFPLNSTIIGVSTMLGSWSEYAELLLRTCLIWLAKIAHVRGIISREHPATFPKHLSHTWSEACHYPKYCHLWTTASNLK